MPKDAIRCCLSSAHPGDYSRSTCHGYPGLVSRGIALYLAMESNIEKLEEKINCGQIEEVIVQAEKELSLARKMLQWEPWRSLEAEAPKGQWQWPISQN